MKLVLNRSRHELDNIYSFDFTAVEPLVWQAGQSLRLEIPAGYDTEERRFTIASAPADRVITITTRLSDSAFKQALASMKPGEEAHAYAIEGDFMWPTDGTPVLSVAFGLGITPFRAMLRQLEHERRTVHGSVLHIATGGQAVFMDELSGLCDRLDGMTYEVVSRGQLTPAGLAELARTKKALAYLAGSDDVIGQWRQDLLDAGVDAGSLRLDQFTGRPGWDTINVDTEAGRP